MTLFAFIFLGAFYFFKVSFLGYIALILFVIDLFPVLANRKGYQLVIMYLLVAFVRGYFFPISGWLNPTLINIALLYPLGFIIDLMLSLLGITFHRTSLLFTSKEKKGENENEY